MRYQHLKLSALLLVAATIMSGCSLSLTSSNSVQKNLSDGGIYVSTNRGDAWRQAGGVRVVSGSKNINYLDANSLVLDPQDSQAIYFGSRDKGVYYAYGIGSGWNEVTDLAKMSVNDIKVDPKDKCTIYVTSGNRVYRSEDCSRSFTQIYYDNNTGVAVNSIVIDQYNTKNLYIATSRGEVIKSIDAGASWRTIQRLPKEGKEGVTAIFTSPLDSRQLFIASTKNNIYSFSSNTNTNASSSEDIEKNFSIDNWQDISATLRAMNVVGNFRSLVICPADPKMFIATDKNISRSADNGATWEKINILTTEKDAIINDFVVSPKNCGEMYYVTNTTFYRSLDGGVSWMTRKLPTTRAGWKLAIDFNNPNNLYLGTRKLEDNNSIANPKE